MKNKNEIIAWCVKFRGILDFNNIGRKKCDVEKWVMKGYEDEIKIVPVIVKEIKK